MNGNQGLEALAALCGGEAPAVTTDNANNTAQSTNPPPPAAAADNGAPTAMATNLQPQQAVVAQTHLQSPSAQANQVADGFTRQMMQQAMAAAAALGAGTAGTPAGAPAAAAANGLAAQSLALLSAAGLQPGLLQQQHHQQQQIQQQQQQIQQQPQAQPTAGLDSNAALAAMQQLAYFRYIQEQTNAAVAKMGQAATATANVNPLLHSNPQAMALALAGQAQQLQQHLATDAAGRQQVLPPPAAPSPSVASNQVDSSSSSVTSMPPPPSGQAGAAMPSTLSTAGIGTMAGPATTTHASAPSPVTTARKHTAIAPLPNTAAEAAAPITVTDSMTNTGVLLEDKKLQKRAANRRSAQLSRKRKKQFIEELKDENDELRRKEQILRSIPDLIVVFDSTGKLWFVSQSVSRFMKMTAQELEGTSFWDRLCEDSVRLLKAAFMDSLAARTDDSDTAPLGSGIWELRLVDKDGAHKVVSLNGVVHFSGDRPECVCSIRPRDDISMAPKRKQRKAEDGEGVTTNVEGADEGKATATVSTGKESTETSSASDTSEKGLHFQSLVQVNPQQSVIKSSADSSGGIDQKVKGAGGKRREAARISDGDSGSSADSGSSDEMEQ